MWCVGEVGGALTLAKQWVALPESWPTLQTVCGDELLAAERVNRTKVAPRCAMRNAAQIDAERERPPKQCTNTLALPGAAVAK